MDLRYLILLLLIACGGVSPDAEVESRLSTLKEAMPWAFNSANPQKAYIYLWELHWFVAGNTFKKDGNIEIQIEKLFKDKFYVYVHEIGHAMGLEHSEDPESIMNSEAKERSLDQAVNDLLKECFFTVCKPINAIPGKPY